MKKLRTIFMGTPDFSVPCLKRLTEVAEVIAVVTQPDKPRGRGQKLSPSPVKAFALEHGLPVYQPARIKTPEFEQVLVDLQPDLMVVVAFGQILSQRIRSEKVAIKDIKLRTFIAEGNSRNDLAAHVYDPRYLYCPALS